MENSLKEFLDLVKIYQFESRYAQDITAKSYFGSPLKTIIEAERRLLSKETPSVAYFSMEYGLATSFYNCFTSNKPPSDLNNLPEQDVFSNMRIRDYYFDFKVDHRIMDLPIYSGGLGILAGDTLKSTADLGISLAAIGILWQKGYFKQNFWFKDGQVPEQLNWDPYSYPGLIPLDTVIKIPLKFGELHLRLWKYYVYSIDKKNVVTLILLDSELDENRPELRGFTDQLYKSDNAYIKIMQRAILGIGGIKALEALGYNINKYHLNEGHAALALVEKSAALCAEDLNCLKRNFIYTCHTPVAAGHDRFAIKDLEKILPDKNLEFIKNNGLEGAATANFTTLLMSCCGHTNAVAKKHGEVARAQFPQYADKIETITNGVHIPTWISDDVVNLLKSYEVEIGECLNGQGLKNLDKLRNNEQFRLGLWNAHQANKRQLRSIFENWGIKENVFTLCWARRIAAYKRPSLILQNPKRLAEIAKKFGPIQIFIAGKAHPNDNIVGTFINEMMDKIDALSKQSSILKIVMLENYDIYFGKILTNCVDVWLNNPLPPFEASGTSGMKAILNGLVQLTTLDGWVVEAEDAGMGRIFGYRHKSGEPIGSECELRLESDAAELYNSLEELVKLYYETNLDGKSNINSKWIDMMINCLVQGAFFNTHRMVEEYRDRMWFDKI